MIGRHWIYHGNTMLLSFIFICGHVRLCTFKFYRIYPTNRESCKSVRQNPKHRICIGSTLVISKIHMLNGRAEDGLDNVEDTFIS